MNLSFPRKGKGLGVNSGGSLKGLLLKERTWTRVQGELKEAAGWLPGHSHPAFPEPLADPRLPHQAWNGGRRPLAQWTPERRACGRPGAWEGRTGPGRFDPRKTPRRRGSEDLQSQRLQAGGWSGVGRLLNVPDA